MNVEWRAVSRGETQSVGCLQSGDIENAAPVSLGKRKGSSPSLRRASSTSPVAPVATGAQVAAAVVPVSEADGNDAVDQSASSGPSNSSTRSSGGQTSSAASALAATITSPRLEVGLEGRATGPAPNLLEIVDNHDADSAILPGNRFALAARASSGPAWTYRAWHSFEGVLVRGLHDSDAPTTSSHLGGSAADFDSGLPTADQVWSDQDQEELSIRVVFAPAAKSVASELGFDTDELQVSDPDTSQQAFPGAQAAAAQCLPADGPP